MENRIYCYAEVCVKESIFFTKGKYYKIIQNSYYDDNNILVKCNKIHCIRFTPKQFDEYFYTSKQLRKNKLENIWKSQTI